MTKKEVFSYITKEITKVMAESSPSTFGKLQVFYQNEKDKKNSVTLFLREGDISFFAACDIADYTTKTLYVSRKKGKDYWEKISEKEKEPFYWYNGGHNKTDIKRYCINKFERELISMIKVFQGELEKEKKRKSIPWV